MHRGIASVLRRGQNALLAFCAYWAGSLTLGAFFAFPIYGVLARAGDVDFDSALRRSVALCALLLLPLYLASTGRWNRAELGFACSPRAFAGGFLRGFAFGLLAGATLLGTLLALGTREPTAALIAAPTEMALVVLAALAAAVLIGVVEEAFFRGVLTAPLARSLGWLAIPVVAAVYAAVHFVGGPLAAEAGWLSGLASIRASELELDTFLALFAAGLLLGALRRRFGHIAMSAGFHAGWVWLMKIGQEYTDVNPESRLLVLEGSFGGTMGYLGLVWIGVLGGAWLVAARYAGRTAPPRTADR